VRPHEPLKGLPAVHALAIEHGFFVAVAKVAPLDDPFIEVFKVTICKGNARCVADPIRAARTGPITGVVIFTEMPDN
jgi:hypothetical protein